MLITHIMLYNIIRINASRCNNINIIKEALAHSKYAIHISYKLIHDSIAICY